MKIKWNKLTEAAIYSTPREKKLKKEIQAYLIDDGYGHHHAKYAKRLDDMYVNIVSVDADPDFTAAISFDEGVIYIGEAFISDYTLFKQISVLIRHELAHNLLMHQTRMMKEFKKKYGKEVSEHFRWDSSIHNLLNIIEDFEISNRVYTTEDKYIVQNMKNVIRTVCGLVTEAHRPWDKMTLEEMYKQLSDELAENEKNLLGLTEEEETAWLYSPDSDFLKQEIRGLYSYKQEAQYSSINSPIEDFMERDTYLGWPDTFKKLVAQIQSKLHELDEMPLEDKTTKLPSEKIYKDVLNEISNIKKSRPLDKITIFGSIDIYTPVEKLLAIDVLKNLIGQVDQSKYKVKVRRIDHSDEYVHYYNQIIKLLDNKEEHPTVELYQILNKLEKPQPTEKSDNKADSKGE